MRQRERESGLCVGASMSSTGWLLLGGQFGVWVILGSIFLFWLVFLGGSGSCGLSVVRELSEKQEPGGWRLGQTRLRSEG